MPDVSRARIDGVVVDESGRPVAGAIVRVLDWGRKNQETMARTDLDGTFHLLLNSPTVSYLELLAAAEGGARQGLAQAEFGNFSARAHVRLVVKPSRRLTVRVFDAQKKPVAGACLALLDRSIWPLAEGETDERGSAVIRLPADAQVPHVVGFKAGLGFDYYENHRTWPGRDELPLPEEVTLVLDGARTARIHVTDSAGHPLAGIPLLPWRIRKKGKRAEVNLSGCAALRGFTSMSDRQGWAAFEWIPRDLVGTVPFAITSEDYHQPDQPYLDPANPNAPLSTQLSRLVPAGGRVLLPDGRPAAGILIQAEGMYFRGYARTAADGSYTFQLYPNQSYILAVIDDDWAATSHTGVQAREDRPLHGLDFRLGKGTLIEGRVTVGGDQRPMTKQSVTLIQQGTGRERLVRWAETDQRGHYQFRLGPGQYKLRGPDFDHSEELTVRSEARMERNFHLLRPLQGLLRGTVLTKAGGRPAAAAVVTGQLVASPGYPVLQTIADEHGHFKTERLLQRMWLYAESPDGSLAGFAPLTTDDEAVQIQLRPAAAATGRLLDKRGRPVAGVRLFCTTEIGPREALAASARRETQADKDGRFTLSGLVPGARCRLSGYTTRGAETELKEFQVTGTKQINLGDLVFDLAP